MVAAMGDDPGALFFQPNDLSDLFGPGGDTPDLSGILGDPTGNFDLGINIDPFTGGTWGTPDLSGLDPSTIDLLGGLGATGGDLFSGPNWLNAIGSVTGALGGLGGTSGSTGSGSSGGGGNSTGGKGILNSLLGNNPLGMLLPSLLALGGGIMNRNATNDATQQVVQGLQNASTQAQNLIGGAQAGYQPYMSAGTTALSKLANMGNSNIAGMFKPLGTGKGIR